MSIIIKCGERKLLHFDPNKLALWQPIIERCQPSGRKPDITGIIVITGSGENNFQVSCFCEGCTLRDNVIRICPQ